MDDKKHTCTSIAEGCKKSTMATWKSKQKGNKVSCSACSKNAAQGRPQHA